MTRRTSRLPLGPQLALAVAMAACSPAERPAPPPPVVTLARPVQRDVEDFRVYVGRTEAVQSVEIRARVEGFLETMDFEPGDVVEAGQRLFTIEKVQFEARLGSAEASVASAKAELDRAEADLARVEEAVKTNAVSVQEVGLRRADRDKARADLDAARQAVLDARTQLSYTTVVSPIAGRVGRERVSIGNLVGAGERTLLTDVVALRPLYVHFDVPERWLVGFLRSNDVLEQPAEDEIPIAVALEGDAGFPHAGYVEFVESAVNPATGTIRVRGLLPNEELRVYPGLFARVRVRSPEGVLEDAVLVEEQAIGTDLAGKYVLVVVEDGDETGQLVVQRRGVQTGPLVDGLRVVDGLGADEDYIVEGMVRARPGRPVGVQTRAETGGSGRAR